MVKKYIICAFSLFLLCYGSQAQAKINAFIDKTQYVEGEIIEFTVDISDVNVNDMDLRPLETDFQILGTSQKHSTTIVNGNISSKKELIVSLLPSKNGKIQIPSIGDGTEKTDPFDIDIIANTQSSHSTKQNSKGSFSGDHGKIELRAFLSDTKSLVQQQLVYTVQLIRDINVINPQLAEPTVEQGEALFESIGKPREYEKMVDGEKVLVYEIQYIVIPQKSGKIKISPAVLTAKVHVPGKQRQNGIFDAPFGNNSLFDDAFFSHPFFSNNLQRVQVSSEPVTIDVAAIPSDFKGKHWLPAQSLDLSQAWSSQAFKIGEPVTRVINVQARGLASSQIPDLPMPEIDGVKQYKNISKQDQTLIDDVLVSNVVVEVTMIPETPGEVVLPEIIIPWYNIQSKQTEYAKLSMQRIHVEGNASNIDVQKTPDSSQPSHPKVINNEDTLYDNVIKQHVSTYGLICLWSLLGLIFGAVWIYLWKIRKKKTSASDHVSQVSERKQWGWHDHKAAIKNFNQACKLGQPKQVRDSLISLESSFGLSKICSPCK
ncbi:MAG: BatD family protein [Bdellovibrionota bacterium]